MTTRKGNVAWLENAGVDFGAGGAVEEFPIVGFYPSFLSVGGAFGVIIIWLEAGVLHEDGDETATVDTRDAGDRTTDVATFADGLSDGLGVVWHAIVPWGAVIGWPGVAFDERLEFAVDATAVGVGVAIDGFEKGFSKKFGAGLIWMNAVASEIHAWVLIDGFGPVGDDDVGIIFGKLFEMAVIAIISGIIAGIIGDKNNIVVAE